MEFREAKNKFVQTWGALGSQWGINKTMAQIHALLMVAPESLSMEDIMEELHISQIETVRAYIKDQPQHHQSVSFQDEFRALLQRYQIEFDERYVWE